MSFVLQGIAEDKVLAPDNDIKVKEVWVKNKVALDRRKVGVGDTVQVNLSKRIIDPKRELVIYVDDVPFTKCELPTADDNTVEFRLSRDSADKDRSDAWSRLLAKPTQFVRSSVEIKVGLKDKPPFESETDVKSNLDLILLWQVGFWIYTGLFLLLLWLIARLARESSLLRDRAHDQAAGLGPYSLARCQLAFWFLVILATYGFIWLVTGSMDSLSNSALGLLGISGGTMLVSNVIDASKQTSAEEAVAKGKKTEAELAQAIQAAGGLSTAPETAALFQVRSEVVKAEKQLKNEPSQGFINDLLTDVDGVTVHRLQMVTWTVVMGIIFLVSVYQTLAMPELSGTLLGLMGLSSATYLGLKGPEKK